MKLVHGICALIFTFSAVAFAGEKLDSRFEPFIKAHQIPANWDVSDYSPVAVTNLYYLHADLNALMLKKGFQDFDEAKKDKKVLSALRNEAIKFLVELLPEGRVENAKNMLDTLAEHSHVVPAEFSRNTTNYYYTDRGNPPF